MKTTLLILLATISLAMAGDVEQQRDHAVKAAAGYRKVGDQVYYPAGSTNWFVLPDAGNPASLKVSQIFKDGIIVDFEFFGIDGLRIQKTVFIKNYPGSDSLTTGEELNHGSPIVVMRTGVYRQSSASVVEAYDYGTPCAKP